MRKITKRSLVGYSPHAVEALTQTLQSEHEETCQKLQTQLEQLTASNEQLRAKIARLREEEENLQTFEQQIANLLLQEHLKQSRLVYEMQMEWQQIEAKEQEVLALFQTKREAVMHQVMENLRHLGLSIRPPAKEEEHEQ